MSERLMILKMLDEGKITLEEADALLETLGHGGVDLKELDLDGEFIKSPKKLKKVEPPKPQPKGDPHLPDDPFSVDDPKVTEGPKPEQPKPVHPKPVKPNRDPHLPDDPFSVDDPEVTEGPKPVQPTGDPHLPDDPFSVDDPKVTATEKPIRPNGDPHLPDNPFTIRSVDDSDNEDLEDELDQIDDEFDQIEDEVEVLLDELEDELDELADQIDEIMETITDEVERKEKMAKINQQKKTLEERRAELKKRKVDLKDQRREFKKSYQTDRGISFDINEGFAEIRKGFEEIKKTFQGESMEGFKAGMKEFTEQFSEGMKGLKEGLEEGTKEVRKAFQGKDLKKAFGDLFKNFNFAFNSGITLEEELTGSFAPEEGALTIDIQTHNGRIEVMGTDELTGGDYRLHLKYNVHAASEEDAQDLIDEMVTIDQTLTRLQLTTKNRPVLHPGGVSVRLYLPKKLEAEMKLTTSNGRIVVEGLQNNSNIFMKSSNGRLVMTDLRAHRVEGKTSNGRIEMKDFAVADLQIRTSNGSIFLEGLCDQVVSRTSNGSVTIHPYVTAKGSLDIQTSNGKIKVLLPDSTTAVDLDARTSLGSISFDLPKLVFQKEINKHGRKEYQAQSENYIGSEKRLQIQAQTSRGSIYIGQ